MKALNRSNVVAVLVALVVLALLVVGYSKLSELSDEYQAREVAELTAQWVYEDGLRNFCDEELQKEREHVYPLSSNIEFWSECNKESSSSYSLSAEQWYNHAIAAGEVTLPKATSVQEDGALLLVKRLEAAFNENIELSLKEGTMTAEEAQDLRSSIKFIY